MKHTASPACVLGLALSLSAQPPPPPPNPAFASAHASAIYDVTKVHTLGSFSSTPATPNGGPTDNGPIQDLIDHLGGAGGPGGTIFFPNGVYELDAPLTIPRNDAANGATIFSPLMGITLMGASPGAQLVCTPSNTVGGVFFEGASSATTVNGTQWVRNHAIRSLQILDSRVSTPSARAGIGLRLRSTESCVFEDVRIIGFDVGIMVEAGSPSNVFRNVSVERPQETGIHISSVGVATNVPLNARAWHVDNSWENVRVYGLVSGDTLTGDITGTGIKIDGHYVGDQVFTNVGVGYCRVGIDINHAPPSDPSDSFYNDNITIVGSFTDYCSEHGLRATKFDNLRLTDTFMSVRGLYLDGCSEVMMTNVWLHGAPTVLAPPSPSDIIGLECYNVVGLAFSNSTIRGFHGGMNLVNADSCMFSNLRVLLDRVSSPAGAYGARMAGFSASQQSEENSFVGCIFDKANPGATNGIVEVPGLAKRNQYIYNRFVQSNGTFSFTVDKNILGPPDESIVTP